MSPAPAPQSRGSRAPQPGRGAPPPRGGAADQVVQPIPLPGAPQPQAGAGSPDAGVTPPAQASEAVPPRPGTTPVSLLWRGALAVVGLGAFIAWRFFPDVVPGELAVALLAATFTAAITVVMTDRREETRRTAMIAREHELRLRERQLVHAQHALERERSRVALFQRAAEGLRGTELTVPRSALPALAEGEYYHADLIGLPAELPDGTALGHVALVENFGAGDVIEIERPTGKRFMVPMRPEAVPSWDGQRLIVDPAFVE